MIRKSRFLSRCIVFACLIAPCVVNQQSTAQTAPLQGFDDDVKQYMRDWEVPGAAVAVIKDDQVVLHRAYGVRKLGENPPVDERTIFAIGSATKAFTAAALGVLVDEGKISWDDPVVQHLSGFRLADPYVTQTVTIRDLLSHRTGVEGNNLVFWGSNFGRDELVYRLRYLDLKWGLRSHFEYQNLMYLAAGQLLSSAAGKTWDSFIQERIFQPLGMTSSSTELSHLSTASDVATPHLKFDGKLQPIPMLNLDNIAPAGAINSNLMDMTNWVRLQLNEGVFNGKRILSQASVREMRTPQMFIPSVPPFLWLWPDSNFSAYGMGWFIQDYRGHVVIEHGGDTDGMSSMVALMPDQKLGMVVLTNVEGPWLRSVLMYRIFDAFLGGPAKDWNGRYQQMTKGFDEENTTSIEAMEKGRVKGTKPSLSLEHYVGVFRHPLYGDLRITRENDTLCVSFLGDSGTLQHWNYDTFKISWAKFNAVHRFELMFLTFRLNSDGKVGSLAFRDVGEFLRVEENPPNAAPTKQN